MAVKRVADLNRQKIFAGPDGNLSVHFVDVSPGAFAVNDDLLIALLAPGMVVHSVGVLVQAAFTAASTLDVGWRKEDGTGGDVDYFFDALAHSATKYVESRRDGAKHLPLIVKDNPVALSLRQNAVANAVAAARAVFQIEYTFQGNL